MIHFIKDLEFRSNNERQEYIKTTLKKWDVNFQTQKVRGLFQTGENIIVDYPFSGKDDSQIKRTLLTAHHNKYFSSPGANDNGSGVAVLLRCIERLAKKSVTNSKTDVRFVFFALEDGGGFLSGSRAYVKRYGVDNIERMYNIDEVGIGDVLVLWPMQQKQLNEKWLMPVVQSAKEHNVPIVCRKRLGIGYVSDHVPFVRRGLREVCSLHMLPKGDLRFKYIFNPVKSILYRITRQGRIPYILQTWHTKDDRSQFVQEKELASIFNVIWDVVFN